MCGKLVVNACDKLQWATALNSHKLKIVCLVIVVNCTFSFHNTIYTHCLKTPPDQQSKAKTPEDEFNSLSRKKAWLQKASLINDNSWTNKVTCIGVTVVRHSKNPSICPRSSTWYLRHSPPLHPPSFLFESTLTERWHQTGGVSHTEVAMVSLLGRKPLQLGRGHRVCQPVDRGVRVVAYLRQLGSNRALHRLHRGECWHLVCWEVEEAFSRGSVHHLMLP